MLHILKNNAGNKVYTSYVITEAVDPRATMPSSGANALVWSVSTWGVHPVEVTT